MSRDRRAMLPEQYLDPDIVYRFNAMLYAAWDTHELGSMNGVRDIAHVIPIFFSKATRTFRWVGVRREMWRAALESCESPTEDSPQVLLQSLLKELRKRTLERNNEDTVVTTDGWNNFIKDLPPFTAYQKAAQKVEDALRDPQPGIDHALHRAILLLYSGFHQAAHRKNIEGLVYRLLRTQDPKSVPLQGKLSRLANSKSESFDWIDVKSVGRYKEQRRNLHDLSAQKLPSNAFDPKSKVGRGLEDVANLFLNHLIEPKRFGETAWVIAIPVFDCWFPENNDRSREPKTLAGAGSIKAVFAVLFDGNQGEGNCSRWSETKLPAFIQTMPEFAAEIAESAKTLALTAPIRPPYDLLDHFLNVLRYVQDWESASVFADGRFQYSYVRHWQGSESPKWGWSRSEEDKDRGAPTSESVEIAGKKPWWYMWWTPDLWKSELIPGLEGSEQAAFEGVAVRFKFPKAVNIPDDEDSKSFLREGYLREQLELMRRLIPIVRARRSALRNASVSIMGRNMSHNIGSHVLAAIRSGTVADDAASRADTDYPSFFSHLQARMDFIAELSTTRATANFPANLVGDIVGLRPDAVSQGVGFAGQWLLAKYVSARRENGSPVEGVVEWSGDSATTPPIFDCAGGQVGEQAFYVIFENLIRNIAKHNEKLTNPARIFLRMKCTLSARYPEYWKVSIWDEQGSACKPRLNLENQPGATAKLLWKYLDDLFERIPFLDDAAAVEKGHWGLKEIAIAAAYLRGIPLDDLEARLPKGEPRLLRVFAADESGDEHKEGNTTGALANVAYELFLPVARQLVVIADELPEAWKNCSDAGASFGVRFSAASDIVNVVPHSTVALVGMAGLGSDMLGKLSPRNIRYEKADVDDALRVPDFRRLINDVRTRVLDKELSALPGTRSPGIYTINFDTLRGCEALTSALPPLQSAPTEGLAKELTKSYGESLCTDELARVVMLDHHFRVKSLEIEDRPVFPEYIPPQVVGRFLDFLRDGGAYEGFPSVSKQRSLLETWANTLPPDIIRRELCFGLLVGVLVLDERVQEHVHRPCAPHPHLPGLCSPAFLETMNLAIARGRFVREDIQCLEFPALLAASNIWVPAVESIDLYRPGAKLGEFVQELEGSRVEAPGGRRLDLRRVGYVVIHQGVIDRLCINREGQSRLEEFLTKTLKDKVLVVCSGRGRPPELRWINELRSDVRFLSVSTVLEHTVFQPSKMHLLMSLDGSRNPL